MFFMALAIAAHSEVRLPQLVSNGMVLQRNTRLKIWGWASPGEKVTIKFQHKNYQVTASADRGWAIWLPPLKAGGPYQMDISASNHLVLTDILVGDVWFCAGQSNMVINMERVKEKYPEEISKADYPQIRNFFIPTVADVTQVKEDLPPGKWMAATPANVLSFGAVTYFFAKKIYQQYHVPIGIINASVGGTPIQAWMSEKGLNGFSEETERLSKFKDTAFLNRVRLAVPAKKKASLPLDMGLSSTPAWYDLSYIPAGWRNFWLPGYWADQGVRGLNGVVWFRKEIDLPAAVTDKPAHLFMGRIVDADQVYVNGVLVGNTSYQYPPRRYELPAGLLKQGKNTIVVRVVNDAGKGGFVPDKPYSLELDDLKFDLRGDWLYKVGEVFSPVQVKTNNFSMQNEPAGLFNTMVAPVINFAVKGVLWYQGEANTFKPGSYQYLLPALIADWRKQWQQPNLPFIYAQLPNFMEMQYSPAESSWAELRQGQLKTLSVPYTGMAVAIDAGEWNDIHPLNKKEVGERMALSARKVAYADTEVISSGPLYQSAIVKNNKIEVMFSETGTGLMVKGGTELTYFAIAGADRKFEWANAVIDGNKVVVWSDRIQHPVYVRYAWADNPDGANLYNKEGLPASPFTTEDLPGL